MIQPRQLHPRFKSPYTQRALKSTSQCRLLRKQPRSTGAAVQLCSWKKPEEKRRESERKAATPARSAAGTTEKEWKALWCPLGRLVGSRLHYWKSNMPFDYQSQTCHMDLFEKEHNDFVHVFAAGRVIKLPSYYPLWVQDYSISRPCKLPGTFCRLCMSEELAGSSTMGRHVRLGRWCKRNGVHMYIADFLNFLSIHTERRASCGLLHILGHKLYVWKNWSKDVSI